MATTTTTTTKSTKTSVTTLILNLVNNANYLQKEQKEQLTNAINALVSKTKGTGNTLQSWVYNQFLLAGAKPITKAELLTNWQNEHVGYTTEQLISVVTNLNWFVQPSFYKNSKNNWPLIQTERANGGGAQYNLNQSAPGVALACAQAQKQAAKLVEQQPEQQQPKVK